MTTAGVPSGSEGRAVPGKADGHGTPEAPVAPLDPERERMRDPGHLEFGLNGASPWYRWGPYLAERAWGSVREDYSADGDAWASFPHEHARSRAYRWNEDGMAGYSDLLNQVCLALALWNGRDPILKERMFGLANAEGNHGEDVKEYWWYEDALPSSAWLRWRYHYPQAAYPYDDLVAENARRGRSEPEYELLDTGIFDEDRYWIVEVAYAKADPDDTLMQIRITNAGPDADELHVLPTIWCRNTWSWQPGAEKPVMRAEGNDRVRVAHPVMGDLELAVGAGPDGTPPTLLFCENETNVPRLYGAEAITPWPKDGINDHVIAGATTVNPDRTGTKASAWYRLTVGPGQTVELRLRLRPAREVKRTDLDLATRFDEIIATRKAEADEFYSGLERADATPEERAIARRAFAGLLWCKQFYPYDVSAWLDGDPGEPRPPAERLTGRNHEWRHVDAQDILSMPDSWEYPWFATWDLAFQAATLAFVDPAFAKYQLLVMCREWFMRPDGALPAYEWDFGDLNPPVHAWAALRVWAVDGARDDDFLERIFHKLLMNFTWWLNREDPAGRDIFSGGFLGLDNISVIDRSHLPPGAQLEQSDATAWMAAYAVTMLRIALVLSSRKRVYADLLTTFLEHLTRIATAMDQLGIWDEEDGFYYDVLRMPDGTRDPLRVHSIVGLLPLLPAVFLPEEAIRETRALGKTFAHFLDRLETQSSGTPAETETVSLDARGDTNVRLMSLVSVSRLQRILSEMLDESEFLSQYGLRALSRRHLDQPVQLEVYGLEASIDYEPGESTTSLFGGNSNWRGPVWFPVNYLVIESLQHWDDWFGDSFTVECPTGSGNHMRMAEVAREIARRLVAIWVAGPDGRRPVWGHYEKLQTDPNWNSHLLFHEYFHGETGAGLGASHQTGWTALVAAVVARGGILDTETPTLFELMKRRADTLLHNRGDTTEDGGAAAAREARAGSGEPNW
jgi:hypothetical protein